MSSDLGTIFGSGGLVISIISMIYAAINHKRIRAKCCGRSVDFEINIDETVPAHSEQKKKEETAAEVESEEKKPKIGLDTLREIKNLQIFMKKPVKILPEPDMPPKPVRVKPRTWAAAEDEDEDETADLEKGHHH